jgi:hypothetical protein
MSEGAKVKVLCMPWVYPAVTDSRRAISQSSAHNDLETKKVPQQKGGCKRHYVIESRQGLGEFVGSLSPLVILAGLIQM